MILDEKGRCCGRKPIHYKGGSWRSPATPRKFCPRCDRAYDPTSGEQIENWAWKRNGSEFVRAAAEIAKAQQGGEE